MTNRVHIDAPAGVIEIEGEKDFVEGLLAKLFPLIEEAGFGSRAHSPVVEASGETDMMKEDAAPADNGKDKVRTRKSSKMPPAGQSCPARLQVLKEDGFFAEHRNPADIVAKLKAKGWTHNMNQVGSATSAMFNKGTLQRTKEGKGPWLYFWDRG